MRKCYYNIQISNKVSGYDQEVPHSYTADQPTALRGSITEHQQLQDTKDTIKVKQPKMV